MERAAWCAAAVALAMVFSAPCFAISIEVETTTAYLDECACQVRCAGDELKAGSTTLVRSWDGKRREKGLALEKFGNRINASAERLNDLSERLHNGGFRTGETPETVLRAAGDRIHEFGREVVIRPEAQCKMAGRELLRLGSWLVEKSGAIQDEITSFEAAEAERARIAKLELERIKASCKPEEKQVVIHKVQSGDTLSKIARKYYRNFTLWKQIYQANRDQLANPSSLEVGQELVIP